VITTIALFLGILARSNLTRAGEGVRRLHPWPIRRCTRSGVEWDDFLLRVFPKNIAKAVADKKFCRCRVCGALGSH